MAQDLITALKKITRWSLWSAAGCMLLLVVLHFLLPYLVDDDLLKRKIQAHLDPEIYGRIDFDTLRIALLPLPAVVATRVQYALPGRVQLQVAQVAFHPHLPALLRGRVRLSTLAVRAPSAVFDLPAGSRKAKQGPGADRDALTGRLSAALARLPRDARVLLDQGQITLQQGTTPKVHFTDLTLALFETDGHLHLDSEGGADRFEHFKVTAQLDGRSLDGRGEIELNGIRLGALSEETPSQPIEPSPVQVQGDLHLAFETQGLQSLQASLRTELPAVTVARGAKWVRVRQVAVEASAELNPQGLRATLSRLNIEQPRLSLDGTLVWDRSGASDAPALQLDARLRDTDATAVRAMLVNMAGKGRPWKLWDTIRGGQLAEMTLHTAGDTWRDLGRIRNLRIAGTASQAHIVVPGVQLDLAGASGAWKLEEGVLTVGPGATARHGGLQAGNGALTVGLADPPRAIDLSLDFKADLADLPALLKKVIPSQKVQAELARVGPTQGRATGTLRLGGTLQAPQVRVALRDILLTAQYERLPLPARIKGPELVYADGRITFKDMDADMGASSLTAVSGRIAWQPAPELSLQGRTASLSGDELFPWLRALPGLAGKTGGVTSIAGAMQWSAFTVSGPPDQVRQWQYQGTGAFETLSLAAPQLSEPLRLGDGRFSLASQKDQAVRLDIQQLHLDCAEQHAALRGTILFGDGQWRPALALTADRLDLGRLVPLFKKSAASNTKPDAPTKRGARIDGRIGVAIEHLVYGAYQWEPVRAEATLAQGQASLDVIEANLCGISTVGRMVWNDQGLRLEVQPRSQGQSAQSTGGCLAGAASTERIEGTLDIQGKVSATGRDLDALLASLGGELRLSARDGRIFNVGRVGLFTNLLSFLSVNNILRGDRLDLAQNDLPYKRIDLALSIHEGVAELQEAKITTEPVNIVGEGKVDLMTQEVAIILLVSPLTTADAVVQRIPVVGRILKGTLVAVPVEVKGPLTNPTIFPMSPKAVGSRLLGIMERTVTAPLQVIEPIWRTPAPAPDQGP